MAEAERRGPPAEGLRERKRRETRQRIADAGMALFIAHGFEATTLDAIAAEAGISRRTFFYYFKSKDEILLSMQSGMGDQIAAALGDEPADKTPLEAVRDAILRLSARYPTEQMLAIDRVMRASEAVQARKQAGYVQHERTVFAALCARCPDPDEAPALRIVAMLAIGVVRVSLETLNQEGGRRPIDALLRDGFATLTRVCAPPGEA